MQNDPRLSNDYYIREAHALRAAAIRDLFAAMSRLLFRRKPRVQVSFG